MNKMDSEKIFAEQAECLMAMLSRIVVITTSYLYCDLYQEKEFKAYIDQVKEKGTALIEWCYEAFSGLKGADAERFALELFALKCNMECTNEQERNPKAKASKKRKSNSVVITKMRRVLEQIENAIFEHVPRRVLFPEKKLKAFDQAMMQVAYYLQEIRTATP